MKTKILSILLALFAISVQAQIPTLAERDYTVNKVTNNDNLKTLLTTEINNLNFENNNLEAIIKEKKEYLSAMGLVVDKEQSEEIVSELEYKTKTIKENENILTNLKNLLEIIKKTDSDTDNYYQTIYYDLYHKKMDSIQKLIDDKFKTIKEIKDIEKVEKEIIVIEGLKKQKSIFKYVLKTRNITYNWFPSTQSKYSNVFFKEMYNIKDNKTSFLNSFAINYNDLGAVVQSEILGDTFRSFRISFGTVLQSNAETKMEEENTIQTEEDQLDELLNGGGNFYLETIYPVYYNEGSFCSVYGFLNNKTALSLKGLNETIDSETFNTAFGVNLYLGLNSDEKKFNFFFKGDVNVIIGSKSLYQNLQLAEEKPFLQGKMIVGVTFLSKFRLAAILNSFGSDDAVRRSKITVGLQIIP